MARIGRGNPLSTHNSLQQADSGPFRPTVITPLPLPPPIMTELVAVRQAARPRPRLCRLGGFGPTAATAVFTGPKVTLTRQRRPVAQPPMPVVPVVIDAAAVLGNGPVVQLAPARRPITHARIGAPIITPPAFYGPKVTLTRQRRPLAHSIPPFPLYVQRLSAGTVKVALTHTRPRRTKSSLPVVYGAAAAPAAAIQVYLQENRIRGFGRRFFPGSILGPPRVLQTFGGPQVKLVRARRPHPFSVPAAPVVVFAAALARPPDVQLTHTRPRPTTRTLRPPTVTVAAVLYVPVVKLVTTRPRPVHSIPPFPLFVQTLTAGAVKVTLTETRPRRTRSSLPTVIVAAVAQAFYGPTVKLTQQRRPTVHSRLSPPVFYAATSTIRVTQAQIRPRPTRRALRPPTVLQVFTGPAVTETRIRPRHTVGSRLQPPAVVAAPAVLYAVAVKLTVTRPRHVASRLAPPQFYAATSSIRATLTRIRPRPTSHRLAPPTTLQVFGPPVEVEVDIKTPIQRLRQAPHSRLAPPVFVRATSEITVALTRTRPRPTTRRLTAVSYAATSSIRTALTRTRPRHTLSRLTAPTALQIFGPPVEVEVTVRTPPLRLRELPHSRLGPPVFYAASSEIGVTLARARPRPTTATLTPPQALQVFPAGPVTLTHTRPRKTVYALRPPTVVRVPSVEQREDTVLVTLVRTRPRPTTRFIVPPLVKTFPPVVTTLTLHTVVTRPRPKRALLAPPTVVIPLPTLDMQTVQVTLVRTRPRHTSSRLTFTAGVRAAPVLRPALTRTRPRPTRTLLRPPTVVRVPAVEQQQATIRVTLARIRPPFKNAELRPPTTLTVFTGPDVTLTRTRPRPTTHELQPPTVVRVPSVEQQEDTIRVTLTRVRPRPTTRFLKPGIVTPFAAARVTVTLTETRPRHTISLLRPPTVVRVPSVEQARRTILVKLVVTRPRPTTRTLRPPTRVRVPAVEQQLRTEGIHLVETRPRPTTRLLRPPTVVTTPQPVLYPIRVVRPVPTRRPLAHSRLFPPTTVAPFVPPVTTTGGGAYRSFKPRLLTADDVRRLLGKHDGILVREQLTPDELRTLDEMRLMGYIVEDELTEEEEIEVLRMLGWL